MKGDVRNSIFLTWQQCRSDRETARVLRLPVDEVTDMIDHTDPPLRRWEGEGRDT